MSESEEKFMENRRKMEYYMTAFYENCKEIGVNNEGFAEDVISAVADATGQEVILEDWYE